MNGLRAMGEHQDLARRGKSTGPFIVKGRESMFEIQTDNKNVFTVVRLSGELTELDVDRLTETLADVAYGELARVAVDLSGLKTIDSSGLSALITVVTRARLTQGRVVLVAPSPFVSGVLGVTRLDKWFDMCDTMADAEQKLA